MELSIEDYRNLEKRIDAVRESLHDTQSAFAKHEGVCEQRQGHIMEDLGTIKKLLWKIGWGVLGGLGTAVIGLAMLVLDMKGFFDGIH